MKTQLLGTLSLGLSKGWGVDAHKRDYFQICYFFSGSSVLMLDELPVEISSGDFVLIVPNRLHEFPIQKGNEVLRYLNIQFQVLDEDLKEILLAAPSKNPLTNQVIIKLLVSCRNEWHMNLPYSRELAEMALEQVVLLFVRDCLISSEKAYVEFDLEFSNLDTLAEKITEYIKINYATCTLDCIAEALNYSKNYLCSYFKRETGQTVNDYINLIRLSKAQDLLYHSVLPIAEISHLVGFSSIHYFYKLFKKFTGYTPGKIRMCINDPYPQHLELKGINSFRYYKERGGSDQAAPPTSETPNKPLS